MNKIFMAVVISALVQPAFGADQSLTQEARQQVKVFAKTLKQTLKKGIKEEGLVEAIGICHDQAPAIAKSLSQNGWTLSRTSLKLRNEHNQPDAWEKAILESFEKRLADGEQAMKLEASKTENGTFRYMKAIPTGDVCLKCHGSSIAPALTDKLDALYPNDKARGFSVGQLRGAFSLSKTLAD